MTEEQGRQELMYQLSMKCAHRMLELGLITQVEYDEFRDKMMDKYAPILSQIYA